MTQTLARVRAHLRAHFSEAGIATDPDAASVTFLGAEPFEVLRFRPGGSDGVVHYVSVGCSRHPMTERSEMARAEWRPTAGAALETKLRRSRRHSPVVRSAQRRSLVTR